ncbi:MAG: glycosyltransferase family 39 protein, partial [Dehalococcoidia bacterium]|nr:glycosyltransferase family 39 protein [Dehalococcoidia bacterium]
MRAKVRLPREQETEIQDRRRLGPGLCLMLLVVLVAFGIRVWRLGSQSLWVDEGISVLFSSKAPADLVQSIIAEDLHPPVYYIVLHYWMALAGSSEFALRFLSAAMGLIVIPAIYQLTRCLLLVGRRPRLGAAPVWGGGLAATLVAVSPFLVYYSQEARNYMMVTLWTILASLALWKGQEACLT